MKRPIAIGIALFLVAAPALAQAPADIGTKVTSDSFVVDETKSEATFSGQVVVIRTGLTVWADKVVVDYAQGGMENIKSFIATGHVRLKTDDQDATGDRAIFDPNTQVLRLLGNVTVVNSAGTLTGPELVVNLADNTTVFSGGDGGRVTGLFSAQ